MILREATIKYKGYDPDDLKSKSTKRICCSCDQCGRVRWVMKFNYRSLCGSCATKNRPQISDETRIKMKNICHNRLPSHITPHSEKTKIKISCTKQNIDQKDFNGFTKDQKYCSKFNEKLKIQIRNKYNNCDYMSGLHKDICNNSKTLDIHHINYNKQCGCNDVKCKLIPLSRSNHIRTNSNRSFWNKLFIYSLKIDKEYYLN